MLAWYFAPNDLKLRYDDCRLVRQGRTHKVKGPLELCGRGLHASLRILDALRYAPGQVLCRVELGGQLVRGDDKVCATERAYLAVLPREKTEEVLAAFARKVALRVSHLWAAPEIVTRWLKTGDPAIRQEAENAAAAAADAAYAAARVARAARAADAAYAAYAAYAAARVARAADAARAAADAAGAARAADAARAARAAADAARAARAVEGKWQNRTLARMALQAIKEHC